MVSAATTPQVLLSEFTVLQTKINKPQPKADWIKRPRLSTQLTHGLNRPLILLSAPAGFGKSTALAQWLTQTPLPSAWISLDESDNDLFVFLTYLTAAIQGIFPGTLAQSAQLRRALQRPPLAHLASCLINELAELPSDFVLVLDDYHAVHEPAIHDLLTELIEYAPRNTHLVLAARTDPPLALPKLRARRELLELRAADLRFTHEETQAFLASVKGDGITPRVAEALEVHSEGWIVGLRLGVLSVGESENPDELLSTLKAGNPRHAMDFLLTEVLVRQAPPVQNFLLRTSILDRLNGDLCDVVTGNLEQIPS
ncbi:MAG: hypothetical protein HY741_28600 [Chloroflexi bacterium]|nr:hypothetical protein [Chloroflexota bacterium]